MDRPIPKTTSISPTGGAQDLHAYLDHRCHRPGCRNWGSLGYETEIGRITWFCLEHEWLDYAPPARQDTP